MPLRTTVVPRLTRMLHTPLVCAIAGTLLAGCNGFPEPFSDGSRYPGNFVISSGFPAPYLYEGSAVQWDSEYAVTVRHIPLLADVVHQCSTGCDLVFIRHPAQGPIPTWRDPRAGEAVTAVGFSPLFIKVKGEGHAKAMKIRLDHSPDGTAYAVHDGPIVEGMSGGPVYGSDSAVLGITVGMLLGDVPQFGDLKTSERISLFLPYDIVRSEWAIYRKTLPVAPLSAPASP